MKQNSFREYVIFAGVLVACVVVGISALVTLVDLFTH